MILLHSFVTDPETLHYFTTEQKKIRKLWQLLLIKLLTDLVQRFQVIGSQAWGTTKKEKICMQKITKK